MRMNQFEWFTEAFEEKTAFSVKYSRKLYESVSRFQRIEVFETEAMGRVLILDGCFMVTDKDSFVYHEMLVHPAMHCLGRVRNVLVIGGGDGGAVTELIKYPSIESIILCEIDEQVVSTCLEYFPSISRGISDPRVQVVNEDGAWFIGQLSNELDLVLVDSTDPVGPAQALFEISFYEAIKAALSPDGAAVFQTESPFFMANIFRKTVADLRSVFGTNGATPYLAVIPSYPGGLWSFTFCSGGRDPKLIIGDGLENTAVHDLKYYTQEVHGASFVLPEFVKRLSEHR